MASPARWRPSVRRWSNSKWKARGTARGHKKAAHCYGAGEVRDAQKAKVPLRGSAGRRRKSGAKVRPAPKPADALSPAWRMRNRWRLPPCASARKNSESSCNSCRVLVLRAVSRMPISMPMSRRAGRAGSARSSYAQRDGVEEIKVIGLRRKIAERMQESKRHIPHFAYVEEIDMTELESLRAHLNATKSRRPTETQPLAVPHARAGADPAALAANQCAFRRRGRCCASLRAGPYRHRDADGQWTDRACRAPCRSARCLGQRRRSGAARAAHARRQGVPRRTVRLDHHHHEPGRAGRRRRPRR